MKLFKYIIILCLIVYPLSHAEIKWDTGHYYSTQSMSDDEANEYDFLATIVNVIVHRSTSKNYDMEIIFRAIIKALQENKSKASDILRNDLMILWSME